MDPLKITNLDLTEKKLTPIITEIKQTKWENIRSIVLCVLAALVFSSKKAHFVFQISGAVSKIDIFIEITYSSS